MFSATLPPEALEITRKFMNKPVRPLLSLSLILQDCELLCGSMLKDKDRL